MTVYIVGHALQENGAAHDGGGLRLPRGTASGRGKCGCGALSGVLPRIKDRKAWHEAHKADEDARRRRLPYGVIRTVIAPHPATSAPVPPLLIIVRRRPPTPAEYQAEATLARGGMPTPPRSLPFHILARTCPRCGALITTPDERLRKRPGSGVADCRPCQQAQANTWAANRRKADPNYRKAKDAQSFRHHNRANTQSRDWATKHMQVWTGPELEMAARTDLSTAEVARLLGRTIQAVRQARGRIKHEPSIARLAGLHTSTEESA